MCPTHLFLHSNFSLTRGLERCRLRNGWIAYRLLPWGAVHHHKHTVTDIDVFDRDASPNQSDFACSSISLQ